MILHCFIFLLFTMKSKSRSLNASPVIYHTFDNEVLRRNWDIDFIRNFDLAEFFLERSFKTFKVSHFQNLINKMTFI